MKLEDFLAHCPRCKGLLTFDMCGVDHCAKCWEEFRERGDYDSIADLSIRIMDELDTRQLIIPKKKLDELKIIIRSYTETARKTE